MSKLHIGKTKPKRIRISRLCAINSDCIGPCNNLMWCDVMWYNTMQLQAMVQCKLIYWMQSDVILWCDDVMTWHHDDMKCDAICSLNFVFVSFAMKWMTNVMTRIIWGMIALHYTTLPSTLPSTNQAKSTIHDVMSIIWCLSFATL